MELNEVFERHTGLEVLEIYDFNDPAVHWGLSADGRTLRVCPDDRSAAGLAALPGALTDAGHATADGFNVKATWDIRSGDYRAVVSRR